MVLLLLLLLLQLFELCLHGMHRGHEVVQLMGEQRRIAGGGHNDAVEGEAVVPNTPCV